VALVKCVEKQILNGKRKVNQEVPAKQTKEYRKEREEKQ